MERAGDELARTRLAGAHPFAVVHEGRDMRLRKARRAMAPILRMWGRAAIGAALTGA
jgi:hypothetical protein